MSAPDSRHSYDVVVVGAGHNGLVAAAYLAAAGLSVLVLERLATPGGATSSAQPFAGLPVQVSPYAQLVGAFPSRIATDLGLDLRLQPRRIASYTPLTRAGRPGGLLVERVPGEDTATSFREVTGSMQDHEAWCLLREELDRLVDAVAATLLEPLVPEHAMRARIDPDIWDDLVESPLGLAVERRFSDDAVRGLVAGEGLRGTFVDVHDAGLQQNRTFVQQALVGGDWTVPVGGMGALTAALERAVHRHGGTVLTRAFVTRIETDGVSARVTYQDGQGDRIGLDCSWVLGNVAPWVVQLLLGENPGPRPEGAQLTVSMLLDRLPRLRSGVSTSRALTGTMRIGQGYEQLAQAYAEAQASRLPTSPPGDLTCHSLSDPSVLGPLAVDGKHVLTYTALHAPARLFSGDVAARRDQLVLQVLDGLNEHLEAPLESLIAVDRHGVPCLRALAPQDLETSLAMPGGHGYHGPLSWPWASDREDLDTPARRWGVGTGWSNVLVCGAGSTRGGSVSGVGGHNAAMAVLESRAQI